MTVVEATTEIDATPEEVWKVVADPRNLKRWDRRVIRVEGVPQGGLRQGSTYTTVMGFMGARAKVPANVLELRKDQYSKIHLGGLIDAVIETSVTPLDSGRTRLHHRIDYRFKGGALGEIAAHAVRVLGAPALLRHGLAEQKRQVEAIARRR
jgi:uncharacterized protein YndB with AHSA1/START domain